MNRFPSTNGHDERGRFIVGNAGGPGNPHAKRVAQFRSALLSVVSEDDLRAITRVVVNKALEGDLEAIRLLWDRCFGKPVQGYFEAAGPSGKPATTPEQVVRVLVLAGLEEKVPPGLERFVEPVKKSLWEGGVVEDVQG